MPGSGATSQFVPSPTSVTSGRSEEPASSAEDASHQSSESPLRSPSDLDDFTLECLVIEVWRSFTSDDVIGVVQYLFAIRGVPEHIRSDNGPEFVARGIRRLLVQAGVGTLFIAKSSPWENGYVESFNGKFRDELLNGELFLGLEDARWVIDRWRLDYNHRRRHSALGYQTPAAFAATYVLADSATLHPPEHRTTTDLKLSH